MVPKLMRTSFAPRRARGFVEDLLAGAIRFYQQFISGFLPASCRYHPSCSEYALVAVRTHGPVRGVWLGARRLARCHPWGGCGIDLVPGAAEGAEPRRSAGRQSAGTMEGGSFGGGER